MGKSRNSVSTREAEKKLRGPYRQKWVMWHTNSQDKRLPPNGTRFILEEEMSEDERTGLTENEEETEVSVFIPEED